MSCVNHGETDNLKAVTELLYADDTCKTNCFEDCSLDCGLPWKVEFNSISDSTDLTVAVDLLGESEDTCNDLEWENYTFKDELRNNEGEYSKKDLFCIEGG